jgi:hypothetical protein
MPAGMIVLNLKPPAQSIVLPSVHLFQQKNYYLITGHVIKAPAYKISNPLRKYNCYVHLDMEQATPIGLKVSELTGGETCAGQVSTLKLEVLCGFNNACMTNLS